MRMFDVQGVEIIAPCRKVFEFLRDPANLPSWAHAFVSAADGRARLDTPAGAVDVGFVVTADAETGVVDWRLAFPDGSLGVAQSRVTETTRGTCIYSFVLHAPPVALGTLGMLQCLERPHRLAYVLGEILDLSGPESAEALGISAALFRKRLQHARTAIEAFTRAHCGLASDRAACACHRRVSPAVRLGRVRTDALDFAEQPSSYQEIRGLVRRAEQARWALQVHRASHPRTSAVDFARRIAQSFDSRKGG